jgi:hypothetical protein
MNTTENNKLLAEFIGYNVETDLYGGIPVKGMKTITVRTDSLKFHSDWNWLMEVVDKIELMKFPSKRPDVITNADYTMTWEYRVSGWKAYWFTFISPDEILNYLRDGKGEEEPIYFKTKIEAVYNACLEFVKWYNKQK